MRRMDIIWGLLLIAAGGLLLLQNFELLGVTWDILWAALFAMGGVAFVAIFLMDRHQWWAVIPGFTLLGLGALIALSSLGVSMATWGGVLFLGLIGLSFGVVYLVNPKNWWAVIPGGTLLTLAAITGLSELLPGEVIGGIFFLGLGLTFGFLYILPTVEGRQRWAIFPAAILIIMGLLVMAVSTNVFSLIWPSLLIVAGLYLVWRNFRR